MSSPFPGMNPYLEQDDVWGDFHRSIIPALSDALCPHVSPEYIVRIGRNRYNRELPTESRIPLSSLEMETQPYLEIRDRVGRELITVIEFLSPTNKLPGPEREQYIAKRANLLRSPAHFVEIDLLRGGPRMPFAKPPVCDYCVVVSRANERPEAGFWPLTLRDRLPDIPIPLRSESAGVILPLQEVLHLVYDRAYYKDYIYHGTPNPVLLESDAAWALDLLKVQSSSR